MSAGDNIAPAGSSSYASNTLHVGDGTWDATSDTFLLPNVQGLNFATMQYNGMGNRFRDLKGYYPLIAAHGTLAAITFLFIVPTAILVASYYHRNPRLAMRLHIWLQILTVILTTIIFVLGYFAVGPERSLSNPHHGIGLALFLLVLTQGFGGWFIHRWEKNKNRWYVPLKLALHQWLGRAIALLGIAQIPIGLTLYGSPAYLFILYTLWMTLLLIVYLRLVYRENKMRAKFIHDLREHGSYVSYGTDGSRTELSTGRDHQGRDRLGAAAMAIGLGGALGAMRRRSSGHQQRYDDKSDVTQSTLPPGAQGGDSRVTGNTGRFTSSDDSYETRMQTQDNTWRNRVLGGAAGIGGLMAARSFFNRRRNRDDETDLSERTEGQYRPPLGGAAVPNNALSGPIPPGPFNQGGQFSQGGQFNQGPPLDQNRPLAEGETQEDRWAEVERMEAQQDAAARSGHGVQSHMSSDSYTDYSSEKAGHSRSRWGIPLGLGAIGGLGGFGAYFRRRREAREERRIEDERLRDNENAHLFSSPTGTPARLTGDGTPRRGGRMGSNGSNADFAGNPSRNRMSNQGNNPQQIPPSFNLMQSPYPPPPPMAMYGDAAHPPPMNIPPPPRTTNNMAPPPPTHSSVPSYTDTSPMSRRDNNSMHNFNNNANVVHSGHEIGTPAAAAAAGGILSPPRPPYAHGRTRSQSSSPYGEVESPPVSVKIKMHNDNQRHVTIRQLSEEEAARERESRRREGVRREGVRRDQNGPGGTPYARPGSGPASQQHPSELNLTPQQAGSGMSPQSAGGGPMGSSPYDTGTNTETTDFGENRRRRRAERARIEQAKAQRRAGGGSGHVEFE